MILSGEITVWDDHDGFGLVESPDCVPNDIEPLIDESVVGNSLDLQVGDVIEYELGQDGHGWIVASILSVESDTV